MSDFDTHQRPKPPQLKIDRILQQLDADDPDKAEDLRLALTGSHTNQHIAWVMTSVWGMHVSDKAVASWRQHHV